MNLLYLLMRGEDRIMNVVLVEDHIIVRQGLKVLLETKAQVKVVGEANNGREAIELVQKLAPDVVIMDISMPELNGLEATKRILELCPKTKILILSMHQEKSYIKQAFQAGVMGYILKDAVYGEIRLALESLRQGKTFLGPSISQLILDSFVLKKGREDTSLDYLERLTPREREVLQLFAEKNTRQDIADALFISPKTVDRHRENIKLKLELSDEASFTRLLNLINSAGNSPPS
ncbi:MAG: response regulator transcription factor [Natronincolaceae bacterium]